MTPAVILRQVSRYYAIDERDIRAPARFRERVIVRWVYFYLARTLTRSSYRTIAAEIRPGMDHTTVRNGVRAISEYIVTDDRIRNDVENLIAGDIQPCGIPNEWYAANARKYV